MNNSYYLYKLNTMKLDLYSIKHYSHNNQNNLITKIKFWECKEGFYCLSPFNSSQCSLGYYCPKNTFHPNLCFQGHYCPTPDVIISCPKDRYCPIGSIEPIQYQFQNEFLTKLSTNTWLIILIQLILSMCIVLKWIQTIYFNSKKLKTRFNQPIHSKTNSTPTHNQIELNHIYYESNNRIILNNVVGHLQSNQLTCILGPSGVGKSTLLNLLSNSIQLRRGNIVINGSELINYDGKLALVPQFDTMLDELKVYDLLYHEAMMKLPLDWLHEDKLSHLSNIVSSLNLENVLNSVVGNDLNRGISGGERKRTSIGMELVGRPDILMLDEPTTGLDASSSKQIGELLKSISRGQNVTVLSTIHAPSSKTFSAFDQVALLGRGGRIAYLGAREYILTYFEHLGFYKMDDISIAEYLLEIASNNVSSALQDLTMAKVYDAWEAFHLHVKNKSLHDGSYSSHFISELDFLPCIVSNILGNSTDSKTQVIQEEQFKSNHPPSWINQFQVIKERGVQLIDDTFKLKNYFNCIKYSKNFSFFVTSHLSTNLNTYNKGSYKQWRHQYKLCFRRAFIQNFGNWYQVIVEWLMYIIGGLGLAFVVKNRPFVGPLPEQLCHLVPLPLMPKCHNPLENKTAYLGSFIIYTVCFCACVGSLKTFGNERANFIRERKSGLHPMPYFLAKFTADLIRLTLNCSLFSISLFTLFRTQFQNYIPIYWIMNFSYLFGMISAYWISLVVDPKISKLAVVGNNLLWHMVLNGLEPTLVHVKAKYPKLVAQLWNVSVPRWLVSSFYIVETSHKNYLDPQNTGKIRYGFENDTYCSNIQFSLMICTGWLLIAYLIIYFKKSVK